MRSRRPRGQSTVEFALLVPLVVIAALAVLQVAIIAYAQLAVTHVAREVARSAAVDPAADIGQIAHNAAFLRPADLVVSVRFEEGAGVATQHVLATASYQVPVISRVFAPFLEGFEVKSEVKMLVET